MEVFDIRPALEKIEFMDEVIRNLKPHINVEFTCINHCGWMAKSSLPVTLEVWYLLKLMDEEASSLQDKLSVTDAHTQSGTFKWLKERLRRLLAQRRGVAVVEHCGCPEAYEKGRWVPLCEADVDSAELESPATTCLAGGARLVVWG